MNAGEHEKRLLIIDDEENMRHMLKAMLSHHDYEISTACDGAEATAMIEAEPFAFILCDVRMPGMDGLEFLQVNQHRLKKSTVIMMSAYGSVDMAIEAMKNGAYDFISKPFKVDEVLLTLKKAEEREQLKKENLQLKMELNRAGHGFDQIIASSRTMRAALELAKKVAKYSTTVLITGESGTGKELVGRGIHSLSARSDNPFYAINCGSIPGDLLESELYGYVKGAFTGAEERKKGLFEEADGCTLFLDEIGELPLEMQVKLLRVLQERKVRPIGSAKEKSVDVRIIAATARDLHQEVGQGLFRQDLFYRLNVLSIVLPSLRERQSDIPELCTHFIAKYNRKLNRTVKKVSSGAMNTLMQHSWPGNIRELENVIQRGLVLADGDEIREEHLPASILPRTGSNQQNGGAAEGYSLKDAQKKLEARMIQKALLATNGNKSKASALLEISYPSLLSKIKEYSL